MTILVTGVAGFVGSHVAAALLARGERVIGLDNVNSYYDVTLKEARLARLKPRPGFTFLRLDLAQRDAVFEGLAPELAGITEIIHLAAQAGVRHSMIDPYAYVASNVMGHVVLLEAARRMPALRHLVYASSSSVYGGNTRLPFRETDPVELPVSLYAATKRADELIGQAYSHIYGLPQTGLRFFTVYGPWGRPDMAYYSFARAIAAGEPITLYEGGELKRDFTYIDDIVQGVIGCLPHPPANGDRARLLNIGNNRAERVLTLVRLLEEGLGRRAIIQDAPRPVADVEETFADISAIQALAGFAPTTTLTEGIPKFVAWFRDWHGV
ncbi:NAD-dependent epimerase/dehydratase family protein [Falsiroseomonas tokyonensis]|uniref:NAD-dependent epimerase/dehydratase family protein n=1 Tax=Falsiroseomonas tokyonensis TaxID=430521 RepID=A0ABV7BQ69_9PROT|nr:NAD-dependent epimerase/dehydratase family protein [Falsiroseomonas tokyonensis]MBU8536254.1 NAD-dependent epimerase/dehydratase family protein [Falsiroseomonas tokyonensis]